MDSAGEFLKDVVNCTNKNMEGGKKMETKMKSMNHGLSGEEERKQMNYSL